MTEPLNPPIPAHGLVAVEQQRAVAEIQAAMVVARASPRDPIRAMDLILQDCMRPKLAEEALYSYIRGGTEISGASIRLAETIGRRWGNLECGVKELSRHDGYSECISYAVDLETNFRDYKLFHVKHWRDTKRGGYLLTDERDIYETIANMGARRKRACILAVVGREVEDAAVAQCEATLKTSADTSPEAMKKMVEAFAAFGVTREQIEKRIQRRLDNIQPAQVSAIKKIYTSLRDAMSAPRDWFDMPQAPAESSDLNERLRSRTPRTDRTGASPLGPGKAEPEPPAKDAAKPGGMSGGQSSASESNATEPGGQPPAPKP
jgi:hypothetical protein